MQVHRSWLYVPGTRPDLVNKALGGSADAVVIDLEDAVPPQRKDEARGLVARLLADEVPKPVYVRINDPHSPWGRADVEAVAQPALAGVRVPNCESADTVRLVEDWLAEAGSAAGLHCLLESALGVERAYEIATASPRVASVGLGEADLRANLRVHLDAALTYARSRLVVAARAAGLPSPVQSVYARLRDPDGLRRSTHEGRSAGFFGRSVIHPEQVDVINEVYTPDQGEVLAARALVAGLEEATERGSAAYVTADGSFVDPAVVAFARWTLALVDPPTSPAGPAQGATS